LVRKRYFVKLPLVQDFLKSVGGDAAVGVADHYEKKGRQVTDEELAKKMKLKVTEIRTVLNRLHYRGIACYKKTKNKKNGWYNYTWEIKKKRIVELIMEEQRESIEKLEQKQVFGKNYDFFSCKKSCSVIPFEIAAEYQFRCPECGETMNSFDYNKRLKDIKGQIEIMKKDVGQLQKMTQQENKGRKTQKLGQVLK